MSDRHYRPGAILLLALPVLLAGAGLAAAEIVQRGEIRVGFSGKLTPHTLPRKGTAPVRVSVGAKIFSTSGQNPPQLRRISIAINRHGYFEPKGLPVCPLREIQPATTANALAACGPSRVGTGQFSASSLFSQQAPFPSEGKIYAFNSIIRGHPAILAHVYGQKPVPTSFTIIFVLRRSKGTFATVLEASLPEATGNSGYITGLSLNLGRSFSFHGKRRSYLSAGCPAPNGVRVVSFPFARASFAFRDKVTLHQTLTRSCDARG